MENKNKIKSKSQILIKIGSAFLLLASVFVLGQLVLAKNGNGGFQIKTSYIEVVETDYPQNIALVKKEKGKEEVAGQVKIVDQYLISDLPEDEFLDEYSYLKEGFQGLSISLETDEPLFGKENFYHPPSLLDKTKSLFGFETLPEYRIIKEIDKTASVQTELDLRKLKIETRYQESGIWNLESGVKQSLILTNNSGEDLNLSLLLKNQIDANRVYWNGEYYSLSENPRKFVDPDRIAFYTPGEEYLSFYDWSDIPDEFEPELWAENKDGQNFLILSLSVSLAAGETKTIDPEYSSLKAKEELPEKTTISSKTYIKTLPDLTKTLAWEGTVGARYFKDNGQWYSHLLIDDRPNKVVLRNAKVAVELYPGFAKYFDVDYQEERVKKEQWLLERKVGDQWENIELGSPTVEIIQGEHSAGDYIGVKKIYNTALGIFEIEYFLRDGNALKHTITFQNTKGKTETFRVIQKWEGITGDKVNGQDVPLETDSPYLAFHYAEDSPKNFTISGNFSDMIFNEDGTEKTEECLQRPVKIDKDIQGMKADFVYGNWVLVQNESLAIDPGTATLSDPTDDGYIDGDGYRKDDALNVVVGWSDMLGAEFRGYVEWDISGIDDGATITDTIFKYHGRNNYVDCHIHEMVGARPSTESNADVFAEAGEGRVYADPVGFPVAGVNKQADLGTDADSDLENQLASDWFAIGIQADSLSGENASDIYSEDKTDAADPKPTLYVEYTLKALGESCSSPDECDSGNCSGGVCCEDGKSCTLYDFSSCDHADPDQDCWAKEMDTATDPSGPDDGSLVEADAGDYANLASGGDDNNRWVTELADEDQEYDFQVYKFYIDESESSVTKLDFTWEGHGETHGEGYPTDFYAWNYEASTWDSWHDAVTFTEETDQTASGTISNSIEDYIDDNSKLSVLATTKKYVAIVGRVFVTSCSGTGKLSTWADTSSDGLTGGDEICQARADAASLGGTWTAWLSTSAVDAKDRITDQAYYLVDRTTKVCDNKADLTDGTIDHEIDVNELGETGIIKSVWTGTNDAGTRATDDCCQNWSAESAYDEADEGHTSYADWRWTYMGTTDCMFVNTRVYCFED